MTAARDRLQTQGHVTRVERTAPAVPDAFTRVYAEHYRDVYRLALAVTRSADEAEEVASETFERALRAWRQIPTPPLPWLLLTARRLATDRWRRARRWAKLRIEHREGDQVDSDASRAEFWLWFEAIGTVLSERQRLVLVLRYQRDLTDRDIGEVMGLSESGVRSLAARALEVLRSHPELL